MTPIVVSLCDVTGHAVEPWAEAGAICYCVDIQHSIRKDRIVKHGRGEIRFVWGDVRSWTPPSGTKPIFVIVMTPCTDVAGSGARDWQKKRGYLLRDAIEMFEAGRQCAVWAGCPYIMENSVGLLSSIPHIGKPDYYFHPWQYAGWCEDDNYTKYTCIWSGGGFVMPPPRPAPYLGPPDDRIHKASPTDDRGDIRSASPRGFFRAVHVANCLAASQLAA